MDKQTDIQGVTSDYGKYKLGGCFRLWLVSSHQTFKSGISNNTKNDNLVSFPKCDWI